MNRRWLTSEKEKELRAAGRIKADPVTNRIYRTRADDELIQLGVPPELLSAPLITLDLPMPPSSNKYWTPVPVFTPKGVRGRQILGLEGKAYRKEVWIAARKAGIHKPLTCRLHMTTVLHFRNRGIADVTNRSKCLDDALAHAGVYLDDGQIDHSEQIRGDVVKGGRVVVAIYQYAGPPPKYEEPQ